jgi:hypothetical protein
MERIEPVTSFYPHAIMIYSSRIIGEPGFTATMWLGILEMLIFWNGGRRNIVGLDSISMQAWVLLDLDVL